jgi:hypothetical protein
VQQATLAINKSDVQLLGELEINLGDAWTADTNTIRRTPGASSGATSLGSFSPTDLVP